MATKIINKKLSKAERDAAALFGRMGGKANARKAGKEGVPSMSERGHAGADARWGKKVSKKGSQ